ncbi:hypothetical protein [Bacillus mycoides]|uniref:hypothetical protein n=1 Tax=Bacillus mycoides TaxID=1405 RepID=UPI000B4BDE47|nr:hypothetical protein [Bacillus mycoides]
MNKLEIKRILLDDENSRLLYDFINGEIILLVTDDKKQTKTFEVIDEFNALTFTIKRDYWREFMKKCGREVSGNLGTYEEEKSIAIQLLNTDED